MLTKPLRNNWAKSLISHFHLPWTERWTFSYLNKSLLALTKLSTVFLFGYNTQSDWVKGWGKFNMITLQILKKNITKGLAGKIFFETFIFLLSFPGAAFCCSLHAPLCFWRQTRWIPFSASQFQLQYTKFKSHIKYFRSILSSPLSFFENPCLSLMVVTGITIWIQKYL